MAKKLLAWLVVCIFTFQLTPFSAVCFAKDNIALDSSQEESAEFSDIDSKIVREIEENREEKVKCFELNDGQVLKIEYPVAVHKQDENDLWQDIFAEERANFVNFSQFSDSEKMIEIQREDYEIFWNYENTLKTEITGTDENRKTYKHIYENVDLEYIINQNTLKENIVLNSPNVQKEFEVGYNLNNLVANQIDDKTIELLNKNNKCVYTISAPEMFDSKGESCKNLSLQILENKGTKLKVKIICDKNWIENNERLFPIFVDPDYKDENFDFKNDTGKPVTVCTNWRKKDTDLSVFLNLMGSDFGEIGVIKISIYGKNAHGEQNCTYETQFYFLEANKVYELYNRINENGCNEVQIRFVCLPGQCVQGAWSPDYNGRDSRALTIGGRGKKFNATDTPFRLMIQPNKRCWTQFRTKATDSSVYLTLGGSGKSVDVSVWGIGGTDAQQNCTNHHEKYTLDFGKRYELFNTVNESHCTGVQLRFEGDPGTEIVGKWSPDFDKSIEPPGWIVVNGKSQIESGIGTSDAVTIRPIPMEPYQFGTHFELNVEPISQHPEFPTGCESVSAVMVLHFYDHGIAVRDFIDRFLIRKSLTEGPDPNSAFVGNPYKNRGSDQGYGCFSPVIAKAMNKVLNGCRAEVIRGQSLPSIAERYVKTGNPVLLWATMGMRKTSPGTTWTIGYVDENAQFRRGDRFTWPRNEHCVVLIGFNEKDYFVNDPYQTIGRVKGAYEKRLLEQRFVEMGSQAVVVHRTVVPVPKQPVLKPTDLNGAIVKKVQDFAKGLGVQTVKNAAEPIFMVVGAFANSSEIQSMTSRVEAVKIGDQQVYIMGKITGDVVSTLVGIAQTAIGISEIAGGIGGGVVGAGLSSTGLGALAGVPVMVVSGATVATGTATATAGVSLVCSSMGNLGKDLVEFKENRVPLDRETVLGDGTYKPTNKDVQGAKVYEKDGKYYHRDKLHRGKGSHLEVYDKRGNHLGEADIRTGDIKPGTADPRKNLKW